ncbi:MAG: YraN family protein [Rhodobacterales bacterium]|nr:YraN family protein [Rhodobacterales bacterium]
MSRDRQGAELRGRRAEGLCVLALRLKGYRILARRLKTPAGEIDILARRGRVLAVVEVKTRAAAAAALEAVTPRQRQRLARAAEALTALRPDLFADGPDLRFDVMAVTPGRWPRHLADAWRPGE